MRNIKELLEILLLKSKETRDGTYFRFKNSNITCFGLCSLSRSLKNDNILTHGEEYHIHIFLINEIIENDYSHYPVIYTYCDYGKMNSFYFFKNNDWDTRIKWLEEVISKLN